MHMHGQELQQFEKVNQLRKKLIPDAGGKFRLYDTSGALLGIAASKEAVAKLYRRSSLENDDERAFLLKLSPAFFISANLKNPIKDCYSNEAEHG